MATLLSRAGFVVLGICLLNVGAIAQKPSFEVASVRPNVTGGSGRMTTDGDRFTGTFVTLRTLLRWGYRPPAGGPLFYDQNQLIGVPDWADTDHFDVQARAESSIPVEQMQLMVQALLEDRFQLKAHRETRELPVYNLVIARGGHKLKLSEDQGPTGAPRVIADPTAPIPRGRTNITTSAVDGGRVRATLEGRAVSMAGLANRLQGMVDHPVIDKTDLKDQLFDFSVQIVLDFPESSPPTPGLAGTAGPAAAASTPSNIQNLLFKAFQDHLGLRVEPGKAASEVFVIDSVQKPTAN